MFPLALPAYPPPSFSIDLPTITPSLLSSLSPSPDSAYRVVSHLPSTSDSPLSVNRQYQRYVHES